MAAARGLHHAALVVGDLEAAIAFYCGALDFTPVKHSAWEAPHPLFDALTGLRDSAAEFALLGHRNCYLELFSYASSREQTPILAAADRPGLRHLAFQVDDVDATFRHLLSCGAEPVGEPVTVSGGGSAVYCRDPFGTIIELLRPAGAMPPLPLPEDQPNA